ncbi:hypothetical protein TKK_0006818 [Trichogramma kaykai]|uniref:Uncharacterized protein n=1 Tax=Trichogramma kaykai TaxID=54128 RepID=A0ABD2XC87_9HYME
MNEPSCSTLTTPERRKEYVLRWLINHPDTNLNSDGANYKTTPPNSPGTKQSSDQVSSPILSRNKCGENASTTSPNLGKKRPAESPILTSRKSRFKRSKTLRRDSKGGFEQFKNFEGIQTSTQTSDNIVDTNSSNTNAPPVCRENLMGRLNTLYEEPSQFIESVSSSERESQVSKIQKDDKKGVGSVNLKKFKDFEEPKTSTQTSDMIIDTSSSSTITPQVCKDNWMERISKTLCEQPSQFIESVSSDEHKTQISKIHIDDSNSEESENSDKVLIEEVNSQLFIESSDREEIFQPSQVISNPSTSSSSQSLNDQISEGSDSEITKSSSQTQNDINIIETQFHTKTNFVKTTYITQYSSDQPKKKKYSKKSTLLNILNAAMAKEKSRVVLFRHKIAKTPSIFKNEPYVIFEIVDNLPSINNNQVFKCNVIEDETKILKDIFLKKRCDSVSVMNVPEVSGLINVKEKPLLKVFKPVIIIDPHQRIIVINKFIAMPNNSTNINSILNLENNVKVKELYKFTCPCIKSNCLSDMCKTKFCDIDFDMKGAIFEYKT